MPSIQIRNVPAEIYEALALRAREEKRSLAQQALTELGRISERGTHGRRKRILRQIRRDLEERKPRDLDIAPETLIREDRDR